MFNWFRKPKQQNTEGLITSVMNAVTSALSSKDLYQFMQRERNYNTLNRGLSLSAVYCAMNLYASSVSTLPRNVMVLDTSTGEASRKVMSSEGKHPSIRIFLQYANRALSADDMMTMITNDLLSDGNFYALREFDSQGRTFNIHYIHPSRIPKGNIHYTTGKEKDSNGDIIPAGILAYRIETGNSAISNKPNAVYITRDQIVHIKGPIPDYQYNRSVGVIENASRSFNFAENTEVYGSKFYEKGTNSQTFLSTDQVLGAQVIKELSAFFENNPNAPLEDAFKTRILDRNLKPVNVTIPLGQLQFIETKAFSVEDIARWFAIPPEMLHSRMGGTGITVTPEVVNQFIQWGIGPFLTRIANQLRDELLPLSSQLMYNFEFERIYLYRTLLGDLSQAVRNLFEIGVLNRMQIGKLIGIHVDPKDKQNRQLYVPTNLMTVQHGLALEEKAQTANLLIAEQVRAAELANDNYMSPQDMLTHKAAQQPSTNPDGKLLKDGQDKSPDQQNEDKKIRTAKNALIAVITNLQEHWVKVRDQKQEKITGHDDFKNSLQEWEHDKFYPLVQRTLAVWEDSVPELTPFNSTVDIINEWKSNSFTSVLEKCNETRI